MRGALIGRLLGLYHIPLPCVNSTIITFHNELFEKKVLTSKVANTFERLNPIFGDYLLPCIWMFRIYVDKAMKIVYRNSIHYFKEMKPISCELPTKSVRRIHISEKSI